jgi:hypothetical protein
MGRALLCDLGEDRAIVPMWVFHGIDEDTASCTGVLPILVVTNFVNNEE